MVKYEYRQVYASSIPLQGSGSVDRYLNKLGLQGWELVSAGLDEKGRFLYILKRPLVEEAINETLAS